MQISVTKMINLTYQGFKLGLFKRNGLDSTNPTKEESKKVQDYMNAKAVNNAALVQTNGLYQVKKLVADVENSINSGLEDKILEYDTFVKKMLKKHKGKNTCQFKDSNGVKYSYFQDDSSVQIEITQEYKKAPQNYYNKELSDNSHSNQTAYVFVYGDKIEYDFRDYNLDDDHGCTSVVFKNGTIRSIETGQNMRSPAKYKYYYDKNGNLLAADVNIYYKRGYKGKNARMIFNKDRKVEKIYYGIERNYKGKIRSIEEIYTITPNGLYKKEK